MIFTPSFHWSAEDPHVGLGLVPIGLCTPRLPDHLSSWPCTTWAQGAEGCWFSAPALPQNGP